MKHPLLVSIACFVVVSGAFAGQGKHKITPAKARTIALAKVKGSVTATPKLEHEDGVWQYEVIVRNGKHMTEVNVNADTGKIGSVEQTSAKEEARETKSEKNPGAKKKAGKAK